MKKKETLGTRIVKLREMHNKTQIELATEINITKSMLSKYENDINMPKADIVERLAERLFTTTDYLLLKIDEPGSPEKIEGWYQLSLEEINLVEQYRRLGAEDRGRIKERFYMLSENKGKRIRVKK